MTIRCATEKHLRRDLSDHCKRALVTALDEGGLVCRGSYWSGKINGRYQLTTVMTLYDRYLVSIHIEGRAPAMKVAKLTPVGEYAALEIKRQMQDGVFNRPAKGELSEASLRFIAEVTGA